MGLHDRDYMREPYDEYGYRPKRRTDGMSVTMRIVIVCFGIWLLNGLLYPQTNTMMKSMAVYTQTLFHPEYWWQFITAGFAHSPVTFWHIGWNMFALVFFGYGFGLVIGGPRGLGFQRGVNVEDRLGKAEYLAFYLATIIVGNVAYSVINYATGNAYSSAWGASGGVTGIVILFALLYPYKVILFMGVLPLPMWAIGIFTVGMDAYGAAGYGCGGIAYSIHLTGAAFALFYFLVFLRSGNTLTGPFVRIGKYFSTPRKPKLKIHEAAPEPPKPEAPQKTARDEAFEKRLDEILDRVGQVGEAGLTHEERKFLMEASRRYKNKKR